MLRAVQYSFSILFVVTFRDDELKLAKYLAKMFSLSPVENDSELRPMPTVYPSTHQCDTSRHNENKKGTRIPSRAGKDLISHFRSPFASHRFAIFASVRLRERAERAERIESLARLITYEFAFRRANSVFHVPASDAADYIAGFFKCLLMRK